MNYNEEETAYDILSMLEGLLYNGRFKEVDTWLNECDVLTLPGLAVLMALTITAHGKDKLLHRDAFVIKAEQRFIDVYGKVRAEELIKNRR
jgi:hypothetical protein